MNNFCEAPVANAKSCFLTLNWSDFWALREEVEGGPPSESHPHDEAEILLET